MIGGVFLLSRDPAALADWYRRHLGWELSILPGEGYYTELYFREHDRPEQAQHLVFAIMPGDRVAHRQVEEQRRGGDEVHGEMPPGSGVVEEREQVIGRGWHRIHRGGTVGKITNNCRELS